MFVKSLQIGNFRNLQDNIIYPCEGINVIYGNNAQGKTNLLESLWLFTGGHSFRGAKDFELIQIASKKKNVIKTAKLTLDFYSENRDQRAVLNIEKGRKTSVINGVFKKTGSALIGKVCAVIFSPEHLMLIKDGPAKRRNFLDAAICQIKPLYARTLGLYNRTLYQRNALLKDINHVSGLIDTLDVWNTRLADLGSRILYERLNYVNLLKIKTANIYKGISRNAECLKITYISAIKSDMINPETEISNSETTTESTPYIKKIREKLFEGLKEAELSDIRFGFTSVGPHRDDLKIVIDDLHVRTYGSQGQQRSAVLSMKLAEAEILSEELGEMPLILFDDVMSELDIDRQKYILNNLGQKQVFITCCSPGNLETMIQGKKFYVENGVVTES